ncbi:MAG TPA: GAF domain-containing protein, partial [Chloroflexota bacterium]|nr:GAF domain-containing protein [Chloroflexota bacterium]
MTEPVKPAISDFERCRRQLDFLQSIVRATAAGADRDQLLRSIVDQATETTGCDVCSIYLWDPEQRLLVLTETNGLDRAGVGRTKLSLGEGITGWVAAQRQPLAVRDVRYESHFKWIEGLDQERFISMLSVPILAHDWVAGVINVQTQEAHDFAPSETEFLVALAAEVASILELSQLQSTLIRQLSDERKAAGRLLELTGDRDQMLSTVLLEFRAPIYLARQYLDRLGRHATPGERELVDVVQKQLVDIHHAVDGLVTVLQGLPRVSPEPEPQ